MKKMIVALAGSIVLFCSTALFATGDNTTENTIAVKSITLKQSATSPDKNVDIVVELTNGKTFTRTVSDENIGKAKNNNEVRLDCCLGF